MKKLTLLIPTIALAASCGGTNQSLRQTDLKIISPTGAPAVSMYNFVNGLHTVINPASELMPEFKKDNFDVIVAPAKGGLTQIVKQNAAYQMAAVVTFGNFALVSTGKDDNGTLDAGDNVLIFQKTDIPGSVFEYLYGDLELNVYEVPDVSATVSPLNTGTYSSSSGTVELDYIFSAYPVISNVKKTSQVVEKASDAFAKKTNGKRIIQAAVFINKNTNKEKADEFLSLLEQDMSMAVTDPNNIVNTFNLFGGESEQKNMFGVAAGAVYNAMIDNNGLGLGYQKAKDAQEEIDYFINDILDLNLELDEEVYY
ncbi:MAG: hypothetical protein IJQ72_01590 [Bacilli bacterium]|nr:hypothetical protein [Bacilli bacterium]